MTALAIGENVEASKRLCAQRKPLNIVDLGSHHAFCCQNDTRAGAISNDPAFAACGRRIDRDAELRSTTPMYRSLMEVNR